MTPVAGAMGDVADEGPLIDCASSGKVCARGLVFIHGWAISGSGLSSIYLADGRENEALVVVGPGPALCVLW